ncbi:MAG TPA: asparagine synthase (glutamine-hydrolyzing) [Pyrinomonadaceae bacterium]|nr:asparagine synthase (glutamine-hydrolyzing) [Pyrinomonadaceae bacterium]
MCGIVGIAGRQERSWLASMNSVQTHRGPDDAGEYRDPEAEVALAMRRLSILDLEGGHQPMSNEDGSLTVVFNGEIFNSPELRAGLEARGHKFFTHNSDTEVLLKLYEERGAAALQELNGMFAFAIYDRRRRVVFGARDRVGIKPLYYVKEPALFAFASEVKSLLALPTLAREVETQSVFHYMTLLHVPGERSAFRGVRRLPPGHWFEYSVDRRELRVERYWRLPVGASGGGEGGRSADEWAEVLRHELREAVRRWMLSDVPVGCSLSGGIDSTAVVGLLGEMGFRVKTYSLGFAGEGEEEWDELRLAREVAARWGTEHREVILKPEDLLEDLVQMVWHLDEPYGGGLPSWYVFRLMAEDVKVGLTGSGGDELFGNYGKFVPFETSPVLRAAASYPALARAARSLPRAAWAAWRGALAAVPDALAGAGRKSRLAELDKLFEAPFGHHYYANQVYFTDRAKRDAVFDGAAEAAEDTAALIERLAAEAGASNYRDRVAYVDFMTQLPEEFLLMTDRFSMAHSLEARVPFLDHELVETVFRIPARLRTRPDDLKYLLKRAVSDLLPAGVLGARKKGFVIPVKLWLRGPLRPLAERLLAPDRLAAQGLFRPSFFGRFVAPHVEGRADYTWQVWAALMFQLWHVVFVERREADRPTFSWRDLL